MIPRELQAVRLQHDFPGEWTFEGDFEMIVGITGHPTRYQSGRI